MIHGLKAARCSQESRRRTRGRDNWRTDWAPTVAAGVPSACNRSPPAAQKNFLSCLPGGFLIPPAALPCRWRVPATRVVGGRAILLLKGEGASLLYWVNKDG